MVILSIRPAGGGGGGGEISPITTQAKTNTCLEIEPLLCEF